jgi:hypothetical protein
MNAILSDAGHMCVRANCGYTFGALSTKLGVDCMTGAGWHILSNNRNSDGVDCRDAYCDQLWLSSEIADL